MHVGLNLIYLVPGETGGMETYARELIPALLAEDSEIRLTAFIGREAAEDRAAPWHEIPNVVVPVNSRVRREWVRGEQQLLPRLAGARRIDLLHSLASTAPVWGDFRRVVTTHDLIYRIYPEAHAGVNALGMRVLVPLAARRSHRVITPSRNTREDLVRMLGIPARKIDVVPMGVGAPGAVAAEPAELRERLSVGDRVVVLTASAKRAHKNLARLLEALALIPAERRPVLVLPGYPTSHEAELRDQAGRLGVSADVRFLGWVPPADLEGLYRLATSFVFPSLYEGFGFPVLEAMARGVPVACSDRASLREVTGNAAQIFDPESARSIADAIVELLENPPLRERLRAAGLEQAARFTWAEAARGTLRAYEATLH